MLPVSTQTGTGALSEKGHSGLGLNGLCR
ncbi:hypothetical protein PBI_BRIDGETTE_69 [Arthrobacter phage Bridgette]|uniref:Uncharacterized protein n=1 Tax=Arthrobacter phage Bridgette TaxID=2419949 RepID=A0A3G2KEA4_9CAUD|nr:hypothetical protein HOU46_gp69 [Arthrobacter phage Bridgette]AYN57336.1 hypothetical protein PBI_BRIDGETTE_69 [Arthrobacter phage Bridgette]